MYHLFIIKAFVPSCCHCHNYLGVLGSVKVRFFVLGDCSPKRKYVHRRKSKATLKDCRLRFLGLFLHCMYRMCLGLNVNRFWFLNCNDAPSILDDYFKLWCVSDHIFSEILRISEKDLQLSLWYSSFHRSLRNASYRVDAFRRFLESQRRIATESSVLGEGLATVFAILQELSSTTLVWHIQLQIFL